MKHLYFTLLFCFLLCRAFSQPFITTWKASSTSITIPATGTNYTIAWVEVGNPSNSGTAIGNNATVVTFPHSGTYQISISGGSPAFNRINFGLNSTNALKLISIDQWGSIAWSSMQNAFFGCYNMTLAATDAPDLIAVTDLSHMFQRCYVFNSDISNWNTSNIQNMSFMLSETQVFNQPIGAWSTANVTNMSNMFNGALAFNQPIGGWNTGNVSDMSFMFDAATSFDQAIGTWNTSNVINMTAMFEGAVAFDQSIGNWNTSKVTNMSRMFQNRTIFNQPIGTWNTANVTNMSRMFDLSSFNQPLDTWNTGNVTDMSDMFAYNDVFNQPVGSWNTGNILNMSEMFKYALSFDQPIGSWNTSKVTTMNSMFWGASSFNQPIGNWNTGSVTDVSLMFYFSPKFNQSIGNWNMASVIDMGNMFGYTDAFNQPIGSWNTSNVVSMIGMFRNAKSFNQPIGGWNTGNVNNMYYMFSKAYSFNQDIGSWNITSITSVNSVGLAHMLDSSGLNVTNYDNTLIGWNSQSVNSGITLGADGLKYCNSQVQRNNLITAKGWNIVGDMLNCSLPITLVNFSALFQENKVVLNWQTATEINNAYFMIQRSTDGVMWQNIKKVAGAGNSFSLKNYTAIDNNPYGGISYYRLQQTDKDSGHTFSQIRVINNTSNGVKLFIYPNPANEVIYVSTSTAGKMQLFDMLGKNVVNAILNIGTNQINIQPLSKGSYIMIIETPTETLRRKLVKN